MNELNTTELIEVMQRSLRLKDKFAQVNSIAPNDEGGYVFDYTIYGKQRLVVWRKEYIEQIIESNKRSQLFQEEESELEYLQENTEFGNAYRID